MVDQEESKLNIDDKSMMKKSFLFNLFSADGKQPTALKERKQSNESIDHKQIEKNEVLENIRKKFIDDLKIKIVPYERQIGQGSLS